MSDVLHATPRCFVEIYPFEGGPYVLTGNDTALLSMTVTKNIRSTEPGTFTMQIAPGGPFGLNVNPQWSDILTPMSLVLIGMRRAGIEQIVMVGIITTISQTEFWRAGDSVQGGITVHGADFQYFFTQQNYYTLTLLSGSYLIAQGLANSLSAVNPGTLMGTPEQVAKAWYEDIMAGPDSIMADTKFPYRKVKLTLFQLMTTFFEPYDYADLSIPLGDSFMTAGGSWLTKFLQFFPFPWYEFFVITAPTGYFRPLEGQRLAIPLTMQSMPNAPSVSPTIVARVNPLPWTENTGGSMSDPQLEMTQLKWDILPITKLGVAPFQQSMNFSTDETRNFYIIIPKSGINLNGVTNDQQSAFSYLFASWVDIASIHRYGYRPQVAELHWFTDVTGAAARRIVSQGLSGPVFERLVGAVALRQTSYFEPTPLMARGSVVTFLRPDIMPGTRLNYVPFKDQEPWDFYIEGVSHTYTFGGTCTTALSLSRGLPERVYNDRALLTAIHTGNAMRKDGVYEIGLPEGLGASLQPVNTFTVQRNLMSDIARAFGTPGQR